ncbi:hypothetical protein WA026_009014 [Henosepilachna vigintioctopunctata]|uniref:Cytochrome P450 n=1 Tax=Henosepilachna vigintioctopunctata TaxID=420089 RepID=A0AAW1UYY9_9CUCU
MFQITLLSVATVIFLIWTWLKTRLNYWRRLGVKTPPYSLLFGNIKTLALRQESFARHQQAMYELSKSQRLSYAGYYLLWTPMFLPVDNDIIKSIMQVDFEHFIDRGMYSNEKVDPLSSHLFSLEGKKWKLLRNKLSPTFTSGKMKMMYETIVNCTPGLLDAMDKELVHAVDIKEIFARFTTDVIGTCAFGLSCDSMRNPNSEFRIKGKEIFKSGILENLKQMMSYIMPEFSKLLGFKIVPEDVSKFFMEIVKDTVAYREKHNTYRKDFMNLLIQLKNKGKLVDDQKLMEQNITDSQNKITMEEIAAQAFIFFEAGFETSSTTMTFCFYELAKNKSIQDRVRKEIRDVSSKYNGEVTYDAIMDMNYLDQVLNETLRKYPPLPCLHRKCNKTYKVPGADLILEKGMRVTIPVIGIHHDPDYYPDPGKFDPDRFTEENKRNRKQFTFLPFGDGPRICIGARFGIMQAKIGLIAVLLNYEVSINAKTVEPLTFEPESFILTTKGGLWLNVEKLSSEKIFLMKQEEYTEISG